MTNHLDRVLVEIDPAAGLLRVWRHFADDRSAPFRLVEIPIAGLVAADKQRIESSIGGIVLSALADAHPALGGFLADPLGVGAVDLQPSVAAIKALAQSGDSVAQNAHGMLLYDRSLELLRADLLEEAEQWFRAAASEGEESAVRFLQSWPKIKQHRLDEIACQKGGIAPA